MRNQPKYSFLKNTSYALKGLKDILMTESSFRIEAILFCLSIPIIFYLPIPWLEKLLLFMVMMVMLIAEAINSAIERCVDLVTLEFRPMAGRAKDVGSAVVFLSIVLCVVTWLVIIYENINSIF